MYVVKFLLKPIWGSSGHVDVRVPVCVLEKPSRLLSRRSNFLNILLKNQFSFIDRFFILKGPDFFKNIKNLVDESKAYR
jgi:hypothetical protein